MPDEQWEDATRPYPPAEPSPVLAEVEKLLSDVVAGINDTTNVLDGGFSDSWHKGVLHTLIQMSKRLQKIIEDKK